MQVKRHALCCVDSLAEKSGLSVCIVVQTEREEEKQAEPDRKHQ